MRFELGQRYGELVDLVEHVIEEAQDEPQFNVRNHALMGAGEIRLQWLDAHDREVAAKAWDEGHKAGWEHCQDGNYGTDWWDDDTPNPYRPEGDQ